MFCIAGLGNPGIEYQQTRHNAGFLVIDRVAQQSGVNLNKKGFQSVYGKGVFEGHQVLLVKPHTFMNLSGLALSAITSYFKVPLHQVLVIYDDLDLPLGKIRFKPSGSAGGHKGLTSIIGAIGTREIPRLRVGIGRPKNNEAVVNYVLAPFNEDEQLTFTASIEHAALAVSSFVTQSPEYVMNHFN